MKKFILFFFTVLFLQSYTQDYLLELESIDDFNSLASFPLSNKYSNVASVKIIYDIDKDVIYFSNSRYYKFHYDFCNYVLDFNKGLSFFNDNNYKNTADRQFFLATINHYKDADIFTFEFSTSDILSIKNIEFFNKVKELVPFNKTIKLFPTGAFQKDFVENLKPPVSFITADYIYKNLNYQALNNTFSYGRLLLIDMDTFNIKNIEKDDIVVINGTPIEMPFCRGIITTDFQPPLSHIVILSHNRRTPIMALKNAWNDSTILALNGKIVKLFVDNTTYSITKATDRVAQNYWNNRDRKRIKKLDLDIETRGIQGINSISRFSVKTVGGKAANFGELNRIYFNAKNKLAIPKAAFAIPFYHYSKHIKDYRIDSLIQEVLNSSEIKNDVESLEEKLKIIRKRIRKSSLDKNFLKSVEQLASTNGINRLRFRSSTNAEDIEGFNGAGLYDSKTGILGDENKNIEKAIKKVWASLWNVRAFQEREFFKIDQNTVAMGVLVHQSFPDEEVNGVAITKNIYREERMGFVANIQKGEVSIVLPPSGVTSELFIIKHNINAKDEIEIDYVSYSSINNNKALLTYEEIKNLNKILTAIKMHFYKNISKFSNQKYAVFAMDVEFKLEKDTRKIVVKQARIY